jgi:pPIWI RE three-gene island domain Z
MREAGLWRKSLLEDLSALKDAYGAASMPASAILDTELVLTAMKNYFPGQDPHLAWTVLNGHPFPALERLSDEAKRALLLTRLHLPWLMGRGAWLDHLERYKSLSSPYPLYRLDSWDIVDQANAVLPERREAIRVALCTPPSWKEHPPRYASSNHYYFYLKRERHEVEVPERAASVANRPYTPLRWIPVAQRKPIIVPLSDLRLEARWMDQHATPGSWADQSWEQRLQDIELRLVGEDGLRESDILPLDRLVHLIGMVSSGKSSLFTVLAVYLARRGYRVALIQSDVASLLREHAIFSALSQTDSPSLRSVPLIGRSTRISHLNRLHITETLRAGASLSREHPALSFLSTVCPLDGLRRDVQPIQPGEEPCTRLYCLEDDDDGTENRRRDCPFMPACPVHFPTRSLAEANIWLATPASLLASGPQHPLVPENIRNVEMLMRHVDVVLVDEADLVQVQFDDRFAPMEVLVRGHGESWLDRLAVQVSRQVYRSGRPLVGKQAGLDRWLIAHDNTQRAVNRLYIHIRESVTTRNWLGNTYFSRDRLIQRLAGELEPLIGSVEGFKELSRTFAESPLAGSTEVEKLRAWYTAIHFEMLESATPTALRLLENWLEESLSIPEKVERRQIEQLAHHLLIMLLVIVLDYAMQDMIVQWPAAEALDLDRGTGGLFYHPSPDLIRMVPEPPMGSVLGFQYYDSQSNGDGELRFFHIRGLGRSLLYNLHDTLECSDRVAGPHVVLTSGTSWAPTSWRYHIPISPKAVLLPQMSSATKDKEVSREVIRCSYEPLPDPNRPGKYLTVSGLPEIEQRLHSLRAMIHALTKPQAFAPSLFDTELSSLPVDRQRILLIVGSYVEAQAVGETLTDILSSRQDVPYEEVLTLIPDSEGEGEDEWEATAGKLPRSMLHYMPKRPARFLIAPLQSIERGHNILVGQRAAIGSVYFLVRPYPVPGDIHAAIHKLNSWAINYVPTLSDLQATQAGVRLRQQAAWRWDRILEEKAGYKGLSDHDRTSLLWTQFVLVWQCIGRLLRGGVSARVHFIDSRWAEKSVEGQQDTEKTSMLVGFRRILNEVLADPNPAHRAVAEALYKDAATAFSKVEGVHYA